MTKTTEELSEQLEKALESIKKLEGLNDTLKEENKTFSSKVREAKEAAEAAEAARSEAAEEAERKNGDISAIEKRLTDKFTKQLTDIEKERDTISGELQAIRVDSEISRKMDELKILDHMKAPLTSHIKAKTKYENGVATVDGEALADFMSSYFASDEGAHYRKATDNSGAGADGNTSTKVTDTGFTKDNFNLTAWSAIAKTDPAKANAIAEKAGVSYRV